MVSISGMTVSIKTDLWFPITGQQGHGSRNIHQLTVMLRRYTNNLNQYAKRANETGSIYAADIEDLQNRLDEIWELSRQSLARLAAIR